MATTTTIEFISLLFVFFLLSFHKFWIAKYPLFLPQLRLGAVEAEHEECGFFRIGDEGVDLVALNRLE